MLLPRSICSASLAILEQEAVQLIGREASFHVHYWGAEPRHFDNPIHKHSFFEICYVIDGEGTYRDNGKVYPLTKNTFFCSRPNIPHQILSHDGLFLLFVAFEVVSEESRELVIEHFNQLETAAKVVVAESDHFPAALMWRALISQAAKRTLSAVEGVYSLAYALLLSFPDVFTNQKEIERGDFTRGTSETLLYRAKLFIRDNLSQPLKLDDVAAYLHISGRHLSRLFSCEPAQTFTGFVRQERIRQASIMMKTTGLPIKTIAEKTGFGSVHYFTRVFTAQVGVPPGQYRKNVGCG